MNTFNRVVMVLLLLATMIVMTVVLVVPRPIIEVLQGWLQNLDASLALVTQPLLLIVGVILALLVDVICAALIWLEVRRKRPSGIKVQKISGGYAELAVDSVARRLEYSLAQLDDVISVKPEVFGGRGGVEVNLDLETSPDIDVPTKTEEVYQVTKETVEDKMGLRLRRVRVNIKHAPYPTERRVAPRQIASPTGQVVSEEASFPTPQ